MIVQKIKASLNRLSIVPSKSAQIPPLTWILADADKTGTIKQAQGFAKMLGLSAQTFFIKKTPSCFLLPRRLWPLHKLKTQNGCALNPPWPDLVIAAGSAATAAGFALKKIQKDKTVVVSLMNPRLPLEGFDIVIAPKHDGLQGKNLVETHLSPHTLTRKALLKAQHQWRERFKELPYPRIGVLLGGKTRGFSFSKSFTEKLTQTLRRLAQQTGGSLLITPSRRTPLHAKTIMPSRLLQTPHFFWDGEKDNPYEGILASADYLITTGDSTQILSEAAMTEAPLYVYPTPSTPDKIKHFQNFLYTKNIARPLHNTLSFWLRPAYHEKEKTLQNFLALLEQKKPHLAHYILQNDNPPT